MREVIKWNEDKITGKRTELKCLKENNGLIGRATIQIFDEHGNLKNETYTENMIYNWLTEASWYRSLLASIDGGELTQPFASIPGGFGSIYLTDYDKDEDATVLRGIGNSIGWCPRSNSNAESDAKRGVYNTLESKATITNDRYRHYHMVYDFGTSQGNGTFNSIAWARDVYLKTSKLPPFHICKLNRPYTSHSLDLDIVSDINGQYYKLNTDKKYYRILNILAHLNGIEPLKLDSVADSNFKLPRDSFTVPYSYTRTNISESYTDATMDINTLDSSGDIIHTLSLSGKMLFPELYSKMTHSRGRSSFSVANCFENGDITIKLYLDSYMNDLPEYDSEGKPTGNKVSTMNIYGVYNIVSQEWVIPLSYTDINSIKKTKKDNFSERLFKYNGAWFELLGDSYKFSEVVRSSALEYSKSMVYDSGHISTVDGYSNRYHHLKYILDEYGICVASDGTIWKMIPMSAHTKLPNPVTKTSADTMKIQYDYYVQIPNMIAPDGDFITPPFSTKVGDMSERL
ncbi:MAG: hypothetical protein ACRC6T_11685 [Sarcina sp.]